MLVKTVNDVGRLIREARVRGGMSQMALASRFGTTQSWVSEIENGKETAEIGKVFKVLAYLGLELNMSAARGRNEVRDAAAGDREFSDYPDIDDIVAGSKR